VLPLFELNLDTVEIMNAGHNPSQIVEIDGGSFEAEVLRSGPPVLVEFSAGWSRPCQVLDSVLEELAASGAARVRIVRVDADDNPELSLCFEIRSIPTLLFFMEGRVRARIVGTASKEALLERLRAVVQGGAADLGGPAPFDSPA